MEAVSRELEQAGFTMHRKAIEVHGLCARCAASQVND
jgi:Fur family zinc uptake transcriptional regulator